MTTARKKDRHRTLLEKCFYETTNFPEMFIGWSRKCTKLIFYEINATLQRKYTPSKLCDSIFENV
jgi:hypothetical protein